MNTDETDLCSSVLLTCESLSGGQGYFHREDAKSAKKNDFKNFAFFASSRWIFWVAAGPDCTVFIGGFNLCSFCFQGCADCASNSSMYSASLARISSRRRSRVTFLPDRSVT